MKVDKTPLIIPIKGNANNIVSQIERESLKNRKIKTKTNDEDTRPDSELTIEELAARQLLKGNLYQILALFTLYSSLSS